MRSDLAEVFRQGSECKNSLEWNWLSERIHYWRGEVYESRTSRSVAGWFALSRQFFEIYSRFDAFGGASRFKDVTFTSPSFFIERIAQFVQTLLGRYICCGYFLGRWEIDSWQFWHSNHIRSNHILRTIAKLALSSQFRWFRVGCLPWNRPWLAE